MFSWAVALPRTIQGTISSPQIPSKNILLKKKILRNIYQEKCNDFRLSPFFKDMIHDLIFFKVPELYMRVFFCI